MTHRSTSFNRRTFLAGSGLSVLGASLIGSLVARAEVAPPKRILVVHRPNGGIADQFFPSGGTVTEFQLPTITAPFQPVKSDMVLLSGFDLSLNEEWPYDSHGMGIIGMMTGREPIPVAGFGPAPDDVYIAAPSISIDQILANSSPSLKGPLRPSIQLAGTASSSSAAGYPGPRALSYAAGGGPNGALYPETRPDNALSSIFGNFTPGAPALDDAAALRARQFNKSVLAHVTQEIGQLKARIPVSQRPKLEEHLGAVNALAQQIDAQSGGGALGCMRPSVAPLVGSGEEAQHETLSRQMLELIRVCFQCDLTRVATFQFAPALSSLQFKSILPEEVTDGDGHHSISHGSDRVPLIAIERFYARLLSEALVAMKNTSDGNGTSLLDNTLVVYFNEINDGNAHGNTGMSVALFGGKSWGLMGGRHLQLGNRTSGDLWSSVAGVLGVPLNDFGDPGLGPISPIAGLFA